MKLSHNTLPIELKYPPLGAKSIIIIMGLRFLTDYLNGDVSYKINYQEHNLERLKNQFKLVKSFEGKHDEVQQIMEICF